MKHIVQTNKAPKAVGPYSQAVKAGKWLFVSGQIPLDPQTGEVVAASFDIQVERTLNNLLTILKEGGASLEDVVKVTVFLSDMGLFAQFNAIYESYFGASRPARSCIAAQGLPRGVPIMIDAIAVCEDQP